MRRGTFTSLVNDEFAFVKSCGFLIADKEISIDGEVVRFARGKFGFSVNFERRDSSIMIWLCRLVANKFMENPVNIIDRSDIYNMCLDDFVFIKDPSRVVKQMYEYGESSGYYDGIDGYRRYVRLHADCFRDFGIDAIEDASAHREVEQVILSRRQKHE